MTPLFHLENILRTYPEPGQRDAVRTVLHLSELDIHAGQILGIRGHNGSGKSTLLRIIALLEPPDAGTILFEGQPAEVGNLNQRRQVTLLLQTPYLLSRSVASNVAYGLRVRGIRDAFTVRKEIESALLAVGLDPAVFWQRRRHELSGGESQRVALAARLALRPRVLLMDEPTASVDQQSAERIAVAARHAADEGSAVVVVSHDQEWLAPLADRLITLREGKLA
ncbi:MAG TPA: energy-coupling factor ABC transporter ATP-binding protein [Candidatus Bilophila faecipullorum]|uniref:Energy-coupling factor ABC transporter ATP-binding protein n=1 Tax=Candidatus Bilophila faecipullorum TaxID=2838482 RepID=A0A9D1U9T1_9BACT|nr:ABC transporter ATP-binding protein [uncultured Bilophila sp.]HIW78811.1 energy-coupling factor ABC transporter ATP-binding protein [Candidatus Bilophila faecipullorum]